jgi:hypothetical protein
MLARRQRRRASENARQSRAFADVPRLLPPDKIRRQDRPRQIRQFKRYWQQKSCGQSKHAARNRGGDLGFPLINGVVVVVDFNFTRDDFWERQVAPAPELRRGRAGHARDGRARAIVLDGDFLPFGCRQRRAADGAITFAAQQGTRVLRIGVLGRLEFVR